ncbi:hypothetical protein QEH56_22430 [Pelagicoccus enzymogenes]|uniref:hypothetical protein n=1 Tax=Pelagicoccus enzymogenes TaxID=2773457 RepID=UPI00280D2CC5|nr:hypothetical protein [Pelagicoccus enzymogenes]MDQ8200941.1 hypothetical protein [Pelagicoccus enzymogenes]
MNRQNAIHDEDPTLLKFGETLINRFLLIEAHHNAKSASPPQVLSPLAQLQKLLTYFLDQTLRSGARLEAFYQDKAHSYYLEFNASLQTAIRIEQTLAAFFAVGPTPYVLHRYVGAATDCLKLSRTVPPSSQGTE